MSVVGAKFETGGVFLSETITAAEIFDQVMELIRPQSMKSVTKIERAQLRTS